MNWTEMKPPSKINTLDYMKLNISEIFVGKCVFVLFRKTLSIPKSEYRQFRKQ